MIESECHWVGGSLEEFIHCSPRVTASGKDPTRTLKGPSRGPDQRSKIRFELATLPQDTDAVVLGLSKTGPIITAAGCIM
eukprot:37335-Pyramimonas_sp.AAC.1